MLKNIHLLTGVSAMLLSLILAIGMKGNPEPTLLLASFALANLLIAPILPRHTQANRQTLQGVVSVLMVVATVMQAVFTFNKTGTIDNNSPDSISLVTLFCGVLLHLALNLPKAQGAAQPKPQVSNNQHNSAPVADDTSDRETGTVKWFNTSKGFGFISRDSGDDIFVHFRAIRGEGHRVLAEGQRVEFTVMDRDKGLQAEDVIAALPDERN